MNRIDFQALADVRLAEATALLTLRPPLPDAAYYLAGYAVECGLKACIAKQVQQFEFPEKQKVLDSYSHNLETLLRVAGLTIAFEADRKANLLLNQNWNVVKVWNEQSRYSRFNIVQTQALVDAITDSTNGVLTWIKGHW